MLRAGTDGTVWRWGARARPVDTQLIAVMRGDVFLLCSDGLSGPLEHAELKAILRQHPDPGDAPSRW